MIGWSRAIGSTTGCVILNRKRKRKREKELLIRSLVLILRTIIAIRAIITMIITHRQQPYWPAPSTIVSTTPSTTIPLLSTTSPSPPPPQITLSQNPNLNPTIPHPNCSPNDSCSTSTKASPITIRINSPKSLHHKC